MSRPKSAIALNSIDNWLSAGAEQRMRLTKSASANHINYGDKRMETSICGSNFLFCFTLIRSHAPRALVLLKSCCSCCCPTASPRTFFCADALRDIYIIYKYISISINLFHELFFPSKLFWFPFALVNGNPLGTARLRLRLRGASFNE